MSSSTGLEIMPAGEGTAAAGPGASVFAHGKVILLGEHAVVYGVPALAGALGRGVRVSCPEGTGRLRVPAWNLVISPRGIDDASPSLARAYGALRTALRLDDEDSPFDLVADFEIPAGAGLGSSAALAVAAGRALIAGHRLKVSDQVLAEAAMAWETVVHGKPSGLDHTVALKGGFGLFVRGQGLSPVTAATPFSLVVGHTGRERDTRGRVARVGALLAERSDEVRSRFAAIAGLVEQGRRAVERGAFGELGQAMRENQRHLEALEVSCPEIERMCALADDAGAVGSKLTGGGGGGCVIALGPGREAAIARSWEAAGFRSFTVEVGGAAGAAPLAASAGGAR